MVQLGVGCLLLLIILVLCSMFEDASELRVVEVALLVDGRLAEQLVHLLVREPIAHGGQQLPQVVLVDHTWEKHRQVNCGSLHGVRTVLGSDPLTRSLLVEAGEGVADDVLGVRPVEPLSEHGEEHGEVDGPRRFAHHSFQVFIRGVLTCETTTVRRSPALTGTNYDLICLKSTSTCRTAQCMLTKTATTDQT